MVPCSGLNVHPEVGGRKFDVEKVSVKALWVQLY